MNTHHFNMLKNNIIPPFNIKQNHWVDGKKLIGRKLSQEFYLFLAQEIKHIQGKTNKCPGLGVILVGDDPASNIYVNSKEKKAKELNFYSHTIHLAQSTSQEELLIEIKKLNDNKDIHGILVQLPLPKHIDVQKTLQTITPEKDADGFHFSNTGKLWSVQPSKETYLPYTIPCTPLGILYMLSLLGDIHNYLNSHAVVIGRSNIVGKPISSLLLNQLNCTVTICHSQTKNLTEIVQSADILVLASGFRDKNTFNSLISEKDIKQDAIVIDVGIHRNKEGKIVGDIDMSNELLQKVKYITPVPGGVGPMTIAMLLYNTYKNFIMINHLNKE